MSKYLQIFLSILILTIILQSWTRANDIEEFEIEKVSLGDSIFKHYNKKDIKIANENKILYPNKEFYDLQLDVKNFEIWPLLSFSFKKNDSNLIIHSLSGGKLMNIEECEVQKKKIIKDLKSTFFSELEEKTYDFKYKNIGDGKSIAYVSHFFLSNGSLRVYCTNWSEVTEKEKGYADNLRLEIGTLEYFDWLNTKAYKQ